MLKLFKATMDNLIKIRSYVEEIPEEQADYDIPSFREEQGIINDLISELNEVVSVRFD